MMMQILTPIAKRPARLDKNAEGDFYTTGGCMWCGSPEEAAPDLLAELNADNSDTYFVRQPTSAEEIERACRAVLSYCADAVRYGGTDPDIILRLGNRTESSDFVPPGGPVRFEGENDFSWRQADGDPGHWLLRFWRRFQRT